MPIASVMEGTLGGEARQPVALDAIATFYYPHRARPAARRLRTDQRMMR